ncbi:contact-dependent growth inhibition system immunity protein [Undibacterium sp.]|uniref:contact-dependent growth inhibition system immunity protein n=1 Tax=Undibacterium sp. TaxID=1914977 RepID=UPI0037530635
MPHSDEELEQFFGAYFHQDWVLDDSTWKGVASHYAKDSGALLTGLVAEKVQRFSRLVILDNELYEILQSLGCYYWPGSPAGYRSWLKELSAYLFELSENRSLKTDGVMPQH